MEKLPLQPGAIVRIKLENFMTFSHCEFRPGPRLNVILGPNGSGKSSLICAIGLGLGGNPKLLGRSANMKEFIKKGEEEAKIEIELKGKAGNANVIVERRIEGGSSKWRLDGKTVSETKIQETLRSLEIQVDNLVQFLPQDRVTEFAQFNESQLLRETIRAVLGSDHLEAQEKISERQRDMNQQVARIESKTQELEALKAENARNEHLVNRQKDRAILLNEIQLLKYKLPWIRFEEARDAALEAKNVFQRLEKEHKEGSKILEPLKAALKEVTKEFEKAKKEAEKPGQEHKAWVKKMSALQADINDLFEKIDEEKTALASVEERRAKAVQRLEAQRVKVEKLQQELAGCKGDEYYEEELAKIQRELDPLMRQERDLRVELAQVSSEKSRKSQMLNQLKRREASFGSVDTKAAADKAAAERLESTKELVGLLKFLSAADKQTLVKIRMEATSGRAGSRFRSKVLGPLVCELKSPDSAIMKAAEYSMRASVWKFMVATDEQDLSLLMDDRTGCMLIQGNFVVKRLLSKEAMNGLHIRGYLDELLGGDPLAIEAAKRLAGIHNVLVGTAQTDKLYHSDPARFTQLFTVPADSFDSKLILITPTARMEISRSRYGSRQTTLRRVALDPSRLFNIPVDRSEEEAKANAMQAEKQAAERLALIKSKQELEADLAKLNDKLNEFDQQQNEVAEKLSRLKATRQSLTGERDKERGLSVKLSTAEKDLEQMEKEAKQDWERKIQQSKDKLAKLLDSLSEDSADLAQQSTDCEKILSKVARAQALRSQTDLEKQVLSQLVQEEEARMNRSASELKKAKERWDAMMKRAHECKQIAEKECKLTEELAEKFEPLPDTVDEIESLIEAKSLAVAHIIEDKSAVALFEKRQEEIRKLDQYLKENLPQLEAKLEALRVEVDNWKDPVLKMADKINGRVKYFFGEISKAGYACAGEVALTTKSDEDVLTYGMEIQVKFRQEQKMSKLDPAVQSGGERSLTTFLYMLALQELSAVPFRVVDEINQGMDPDKERLAFYRLAEVSSKCSAQYFLATPKLLPGLAYPKNATILFVFNGPYNLHQSEWDMKKFLTEGLAGHKRLSSSSTEPADSPSSSDDSLPVNNKRIRA